MARNPKDQRDALYKIVSESLSAELKEAQDRANAMHRRAQEAESRLTLERVNAEARANRKAFRKLNDALQKIQLLEAKYKSAAMENLFLKSRIVQLEAALGMKSHDS